MVPQRLAGSCYLLQTIVYYVVSDFLVIPGGTVWWMPATVSYLEVQVSTLNSQNLYFFASFIFPGLSPTTLGFSGTSKNVEHIIMHV